MTHHPRQLGGPRVPSRPELTVLVVLLVALVVMTWVVAS